MKVLVTGGGGFVGRHVIRELLAAGHQAVAYQRSLPESLAGEGVEIRQGSLLQKDALRSALDGCDAVVHTAAKAGVWGPRHEYFATNVEGTRILTELMTETGIRRLVYCSTPSVVFSGSPFEGDDESLPYGRNWTCAYPESKAVAEQLVLEWGRSGQGEVIALRPHLIWGIGDPHLLPPVITRCREGKLKMVGDGTNRVDTTRVENVARAHLLALEALERPTAVNRPYFISQGEPVILWDWVNGILQRLDIPPLEKRVSLSTAYRAGAVFEWIWRLLGKQSIPPITRFVAVELAKSHWFSIEKPHNPHPVRPDQPMTGNFDKFI
jgi:nucleoside-diphosphate-sugar epimerase